MSTSSTASNFSRKAKKVLLKKRIAKAFSRKEITLFLGKLLLIFATSFLIFFWLTHNKFNKNEFLKQTSRVTLNFIKTWEDKLPPYLEEIFYSDIKPTQQEELLNYKLTMVSKSLDQYFKNLLIKTQEQVASTSLLSFIQDDKNYYNYYKTKRDLQKHLEHNRDILEFSLYKLDGMRIVTLKHKNVPDYYISSELLNRVSKRNNLLLKHKNSSNLVLLSSVTHHDEQIMVISQTINPVFFTRILNYLEASKDLFYLKDSDDFIIVDNYDAKTFYSEQALASSQSNDHNFISLYETFVNLHEKNIKIDFDKVEYSLGMVVERNNIWGNIFSIFTLVVIIFISKVAIDALFKLLLSVIYTIRRLFVSEQMKTQPKFSTTTDPELATAMPSPVTSPTNHVATISKQTTAQSEIAFSQLQNARTIFDTKARKIEQQQTPQDSNSTATQNFIVEPDIPPFPLPDRKSNKEDKSFFL